MKNSFTSVYYGDMKPGDLISIETGDRHMYEDIMGQHRIFVGTFEDRSVAMCLDTGFSSTDVYYVKILTGARTGWVRAEGLVYL